MNWFLLAGVALAAGGAIAMLNRPGETTVTPEQKDFELDNPLTPVGNIMETVKNILEPRGIRNNNPLNIRWSAVNNWNGQIGQDSGGFAIFDTPENGIRAAAKILDSYNRRGITTLGKIISTWAPAIENNVEAYLSHVEQLTGKNRNMAIVKAVGDYPPLLAAMIRHENGKQPYSMELIRAGVALS